MPNLNHHLKCICVALLLVTATANHIAAQTLKEIKPESAGFAPERLKRIDSLFNSYTKDHKIAGTVALVARHGQIVYWNASGMHDIAANKPLQRTDLFRIASQTKAVTCVAVMMLYEEGKLYLDDPISKYIPEFSKPQILKTFNPKDSTYTTEPAIREVTVRDLLTHTSGVGYSVIGSDQMRAIYAKNNIPVGFEPRRLLLADRIKALAKLPLQHNPGQKYTYGLSIDVLGYLVEVASGKSLNDFFRERIFNPLGMRDTYFYIPKEKQARLSKVYMTDSKGQTVEDMSTDSANANVIYPLQTGTYYSGGAGLSSTAYDYCLFLQMLANGGQLDGKRLLSPNSVRMMTSDQLGDIPSPNVVNKVGFSFEVVTERGASIGPWNAGTFAGGGYWGSSYWVDPKAGIVAQIWTQGGGWALGDMANRFKAIVYGALTNDYVKK